MTKRPMGKDRQTLYVMYIYTYIYVTEEEGKRNWHIIAFVHLYIHNMYALHNCFVSIAYMHIGQHGYIYMYCMSTIYYGLPDECCNKRYWEVFSLHNPVMEDLEPTKLTKQVHHVQQPALWEDTVKGLWGWAPIRITGSRWRDREHLM